MKKIALSITFLCLAWFQVTAQEIQYGTSSSSVQADQPFRFGLHVSPTWSWISTDDKKLEGTQSNTGVKFGVMAEQNFAKNYALTAGLGLSFNQGGFIINNYEKAILWPNSDLSSSKYDTVSMGTKMHYRLSWVEIPVGLKMRGGLGTDRAMRFFAEIPVFTIGFGTSQKGDIVGNANGDTEDEDIKKDINKFALSWGLGGGIELDLGSNSTLIGGLSFQQQFLDVTKDDGKILRDGVFQEEDSAAHIGQLVLRIGILF